MFFIFGVLNLCMLVLDFNYLLQNYILLLTSKQILFKFSLEKKFCVARKWRTAHVCYLKTGNIN